MADPDRIARVERHLTPKQRQVFALLRAGRGTMADLAAEVGAGAVSAERSVASHVREVRAVARHFGFDVKAPARSLRHGPYHLTDREAVRA